MSNEVDNFFKTLNTGSKTPLAPISGGSSGSEVDNYFAKLQTVPVNKVQKYQQEAKIAQVESDKLNSFGGLLKGTLGGIGTKIKDYAQASADTVIPFGNALLHPIDTLKKAGNLYTHLPGVQEGIDQASGKNAVYGANETANKIIDISNLISGTAKVLFSPISGVFQVADKIPGAKQVADIINVPFNAVGIAGGYASGKIVDILPIQQESKDILKQPITELGSLAGQVLLGGKLMEGVSSYLKRGEVITPEVARQIVVESQTPNEYKVPIKTTEPPITPPTTPKTAPEPTIMPKVDQSPLLKEAQKYKSAEEFVKAQGKPLYHGGETITEFKDTGRGGAYLTPDIKMAEVHSKFIDWKSNGARKGVITEAYANPKKVFQIKGGIENDNMIEAPNSYSEKINELKRQGYDAIRSSDKKQLLILKPSQIKTKSQLTDIWNQSKGITPKGEKTISSEIVKPKGEQTYKIIKQEGIKEVKGTPVKIVDGVDTFIHEGTGGWVVSEASTGRFIADSASKDGAIAKANFEINNVGVDKFKQIISEKQLPTTKVETPTAVAPKPIETTGNTPSGVAKSIEAKAIESGMIEKGYDKLAGYDASTIKAQAELGSKYGIDEHIKFATGKKPLPEGMKPATPLSIAEDYAMETKDGALAKELANSPLASQISTGASELSLSRMRTPDSATAKIKEIQKAREISAEKKLQGKTVDKVKAEIKNSLKEKVAKAKKLDLVSFIDSIIC